jgi:hypothetical protein
VIAALPGAAIRLKRPRHRAARRLGAAALVVVLIAHGREPIMATALANDYASLQNYYTVEIKYHPAPVPTPLDRATAVQFVNEQVSPTTSLDRMRKLMRVAVFYDLHETAAAFRSVLTGNETAAVDVSRSALALIALAWIGTAAQRTDAQEYFHGLQRRADLNVHRDIMLEVVEAFGPREGTGSHRQWIQSGISALEGQMRREQAVNNIAAVRLADEKTNALSEYLNIQLAAVDRAFETRQRISTMSPGQEVPPLVDLAIAASPGSTPALSGWAAMQLLRLAPSRIQIADAFHARAANFPGNEQALYRARALRAADYFGRALSEGERQWLAGQSDPAVDPLVLRPNYYLK